MRTWAGALIGIGLASLYFAFLGWFTHRGRGPYPESPDRPDTGVASRRTEFLPLLAGARLKLHGRLQRPLTIIGTIQLVIGIVLLVITLTS